MPEPMICPNCGRECTERLDVYWLENFDECARCDRARAAATVLKGFSEAREK